jgi:hypothetical protein
MGRGWDLKKETRNFEKKKKERTKILTKAHKLT